MLNRFLRHFTVIGTGTIISMLIGLITTQLITRLVDPNEYGQLSIFNMYCNIAMIVLCLGMDQSLVRYYYDYEDIEYKRALLLRCIWVPIVVTGMAAVVCCMLSFTGLVRFEFPPLVMLLLCMDILLQLIYRFSLLTVRLAFNSRLFSALGILQKVIYMALALILLHFVHHQDLLILIIATITAVAVCMAASIVNQKDIWDFRNSHRDDCEVSMHDLVSYGAPFIITLGITNLLQAIDQIALKLFGTYSDVGIYASTMSLVHIFAIVQSTFNSLWSPMAVEHYTKDPQDRSFYEKGNQYITVVMYFIGITLILCKDIFAVLLGKKYREAAMILPFLIFNPIMYTISETTVSGLVFMKKSRQQIIVAAASCLTNVIGNTLLVPRLGCKGAAISTGLSYILFFSMRTLLANRYFKVNFHLKRFYLLTSIVGLYALYNTFIRFNLCSVIGYLICFAALLLLYHETVRQGLEMALSWFREFRKKDVS